MTVPRPTSDLATISCGDHSSRGSSTEPPGAWAGKPPLPRRSLSCWGPPSHPSWDSQVARDRAVPLLAEVRLWRTLAPGAKQAPPRATRHHRPALPCDATHHARARCGPIRAERRKAGEEEEEEMGAWAGSGLQVPVRVDGSLSLARGDAGCAAAQVPA